MTAIRFSQIIALAICLLVFCGCVKEPSTESTSSANEKITQTSSEVGVEEGKSSLSPYQFLNLSVGNAEEISFIYTVFMHETRSKYPGKLQKLGDSYVAVFTTSDMNGKPVQVREVEKDGLVYYIMDDLKCVKSYPAPAKDLLLHEMMEVAAGKVSKMHTKDGFDVYEYDVPLVQDASVILNYKFFMQDNTLRKMEYSVDGLLSKTYELSDFSQEGVDQTLFDYPKDYKHEKYSYPSSEGQIPPWWENDGLSD